MPTYRRIVEIDTQEERNRFRTVRLDLDLSLTNEEICAEWCSLIEGFRLRYETGIRFVPPHHSQHLPGYMPPLPGEDNWDWEGEEDLEF
jgi:hypothetical protein